MSSTRRQNRWRLRWAILICVLLMLLCLATTTQDVFQVDWSRPFATKAARNVPYSGPANGASWWESYVDYVARPFPQRRDNHSWCVMESSSSSKNDDNKEGLWFVKNYKAASSSGAGITARMAHTVGGRIQQPTPCFYRASHDFADSGGHTHGRNRRHSLLWSIVRRPASRVLSGFFYFL
jgi:hypothetical protein